MLLKFLIFFFAFFAFTLSYAKCSPAPYGMSIKIVNKIPDCDLQFSAKRNGPFCYFPKIETVKLKYNESINVAIGIDQKRISPVSLSAVYFHCVNKPPRYGNCGFRVNVSMQKNGIIKLTPKPIVVGHYLCPITGGGTETDYVSTFVPNYWESNEKAKDLVWWYSSLRCSMHHEYFQLVL